MWQQNSHLESDNLLHRTSFQSIIMSTKMAEGSRKKSGRPKPLQCSQVFIIVRERTQRCGKGWGESLEDKTEVPRRHVSHLESVMPLGMVGTALFLRKSQGRRLIQDPRNRVYSSVLSLCLWHMSSGSNNCRRPMKGDATLMKQSTVRSVYPLSLEVVQGGFSKVWVSLQWHEVLW